MDRSKPEAVQEPLDDTLGGSPLKDEGHHEHEHEHEHHHHHHHHWWSGILHTMLPKNWWGFHHDESHDSSPGDVTPVQAEPDPTEAHEEPKPKKTIAELRREFFER